MDIALPNQWDQSAWGTAASTASLVAAVVAAWNARRAREAAAAQRLRIGRIRLVSALHSVEAIAGRVVTAGEQNSRSRFLDEYGRWSRVAGEIRALIRQAENEIEPDEVDRVLTSVSGVTTHMQLSLAALGGDEPAEVAGATSQLVGALHQLVEEAVEMQTMIEQGEKDDAN